jgi:hypothetical protein
VEKTINVEKITPALAAHWLQLMTDHHVNRDRNADKVLALWLEMDEGRWNPQLSIVKLAYNKSTGQEYPIDGQHRLAAIVEFDKPVRSLVQRGLSPEDFTLMDQGWNRSAQQQLGLVLGVPASTAKVIITAARPMLVKAKHNVKQMTVNAQAQIIAKDYPKLVELAKAHGSDFNALRLKAGLQGSTMLRWLYSQPKVQPTMRQSIVERLGNKGQRNEYLEAFDFAREMLRDEAAGMLRDARNNTESRVEPVKRQLGILDFALECCTTANRIVTVKGFKQECTAYLKKRKLV